MTVNEYISNFLRDAQYRIAELTIQIDKRRNEGEEDPLFLAMKEKRQSLILFMEVVYDPYTNVRDGSNFLSASEAWTDREVMKEIEYLRDYTGMALIPYAVFTGYYPTIVNNILGSGGSDPGQVFQEGAYLEILRYKVSGNLEAIPFPQYMGMGDLSINDYFAGRS